MNTEHQIEFDKIKNIWMELAVTEWAKEKIKNTSCFLSEPQVRKQLRDTTDSRNLMEQLGTPPLPNVKETKEILDVAQKGECLTPFQLERVEKILASVRRLKDYLDHGTRFNNPLAYYGENLDAVPDLKEEIYRQIRGGAVDDYATRKLQQIRNRIAKCESQMKQKAEQIIRTHKDCIFFCQVWTKKNFIFFAFIISLNPTTGNCTNCYAVIT